MLPPRFRQVMSLPHTRIMREHGCGTYSVLFPSLVTCIRPLGPCDRPLLPLIARCKPDVGSLQPRTTVPES